MDIEKTRSVVKAFRQSGLSAGDIQQMDDCQMFMKIDLFGLETISSQEADAIRKTAKLIGQYYPDWN